LASLPLELINPQVLEPGIGNEQWERGVIVLNGNLATYMFFLDIQLLANSQKVFCERD